MFVLPWYRDVTHCSSKCVLHMAQLASGKRMRGGCCDGFPRTRSYYVSGLPAIQMSAQALKPTQARMVEGF